jgi:hypothetical protein
LNNNVKKPHNNVKKPHNNVKKINNNARKTSNNPKGAKYQCKEDPTSHKKKSQFASHNLQKEKNLLELQSTK